MTEAALPTGLIYTARIARPPMRPVPISVRTAARTHIRTGCPSGTSSWNFWKAPRIYLVVSVRTAFNKRWLKAVLQSGLLIVSYSIVFGMVFILAILGSIIM